MAPRTTIFRLAFVNVIDAEPIADEELVRRLAEGRREALDPLHELVPKSGLSAELVVRVPWLWPEAMAAG